MSWQQSFLETFGTGGLGGMSFSTWWQSLRENRFSVDPAFWLRAAVTTMSCATNSLHRRYENWRVGSEIERTQIRPPIFILGLWRSGTTHLHNLFAQDPRFAFPNTYQVFFPHTFLTAEKYHSKLLSLILPKRRVQDNVKLGADQPQEDDFAVCGLTGMSFMMSIAFPRRAAQYSRFITMEQTTPEERERWSSALRFFLKKLTVKYDRPLVLKSPSHTAHVRQLVRMFPDAKFVLIHRDPFEVYASTMHCFRKVYNMWALQDLGDYDISASTIRNYRDVTEKYFAERELIPQGNLIEVAYRDLDADPIATLRQIYGALGLPSFSTVEPYVSEYLTSLGAYRKNRHTVLEPEIQHRLAHEWHSYFVNWGYNEQSIDWAA